MDIGFATGITALVIAIGFGVWQWRFNQRVEQQLLGSGTTLLEVRWAWRNDDGSVHCQAQAKGTPLFQVAIKTGRARKAVGDLSPGDMKSVDFGAVLKGEKWTVTFRDPNKRLHKESYLIWGNDLQLFG